MQIKFLIIIYFHIKSYKIIMIWNQFILFVTKFYGALAKRSIERNLGNIAIEKTRKNDKLKTVTERCPDVEKVV